MDIGGASEDDVQYSPTSEGDPVEPDPSGGRVGPESSSPQALDGRDLIDQRVESQGESREVLEIPPEDAPIKVLKGPNQPSEADIERHNAAGHVPFRSWCPVCVEACAKDAPHSRSKDKCEHEFPIFSSDYAFMSTKNNEENITIYI